MIWSLQDARTNFSKVAQQADTAGAQIVTPRGEETDDLSSAEGQANPLSIVDHLLSGPVWHEDFAATVNERSRAPSRPDPL